MAVINYATREIICKIVYYGPALGGKTTNLQMIHNMVAKESRGELVSLATEQDRTLYFDFLPLDIGDVRGLRTKFQLYTVPGQVYYNATRKLVLRGADAVVFIADSSREKLEENRSSLQNLRDNLTEHGMNLDKIPWVVQYNKRDLPDSMPVEELDQELGLQDVERLEACAAIGEGVKETLKRISSIVVTNLRSEDYETARLEAPAVPVNSPSTLASNVSAMDPAPSNEPQTPSAPQIAIRQKSAILWRGRKIGVANLEARNRWNADGNGTYQLTAASRFLFLPSRIRVHMLEISGEEEQSFGSRSIHGFRFRAVATNGNGAKQASNEPDLWIARDSSAILLRVPSKYGSIEYRPMFAVGS